MLRNEAIKLQGHPENRQTSVCKSRVGARMGMVVSKLTKPTMDKVVNIVMHLFNLYHLLILLSGNFRETKQLLLSREFLAAVTISWSGVSLFE